MEAARWALEQQRPILFIDPDLPYAEQHRDPVPDPYSVWSLGGGRYLDLLRERYRSSPATDEDARRERGMAFHLAQARDEMPDGEILALVGAAHVDGVVASLQQPQAHPLARVRRSHTELRHLDPHSLTGLLPDAPLAHAVWERVRRR